MAFLSMPIISINKLCNKMKDNLLTEKQAKLFEYIMSYSNECGFPPTREEIAKYFNLKQKSSVIHQLQALEKKGYIKLLKSVARGIEIIKQNSKGIPVLGEIAAGNGLIAEENIIKNWDPVSSGELPKHTFALLVRGESMIEAGIFEGDIVFIDPNIKPRNGEIAAVLIEGEATIKYIFYENEHIILRPANKVMQKRIIEKNDPSLNILGKVIAMWRQLNNNKL